MLIKTTETVIVLVIYDEVIQIEVGYGPIVTWNSGIFGMMWMLLCLKVLLSADLPYSERFC